MAFAEVRENEECAAKVRLGESLQRCLRRPTSPSQLLLSNAWFRTFVAGSGFFADSYDLFIVRARICAAQARALARLLACQHSRPRALRCLAWPPAAARARRLTA